MNILQIISILLELTVTVIGLKFAFIKKKKFGFGIAFTFLVYVFYDTANFFALDLSENFLYFLFFLATASILWAFLQIYKNTKKRS